ncbi:unnamed protein product, partial [Ectocarpus sp. 8 AP-2014]
HLSYRPPLLRYDSPHRLLLHLDKRWTCTSDVLSVTSAPSSLLPSFLLTTGTGYLFLFCPRRRYHGFDDRLSHQSESRRGRSTGRRLLLALLLGLFRRPLPTSSLYYTWISLRSVTHDNVTFLQIAILLLLAVRVSRP